MVQLANEYRVLLQVAQNASRGSLALEPDLLPLLQWDLILDSAIRYKILPLVYRLLKSYIPSKLVDSFELELARMVSRQQYLLAEAEHLTYLAEQADLNLLIIKGLAFAKAIYDEPSSRFYNDLDLLLSEEQMPAMDRILRSEGYFQIYGFGGFEKNRHNRLPFPLFKSFYQHEYYGYYKEFAKDQFVRVELARYVHDSIKTRQLLAELFNNCRTVKINHHLVNMPDLPYLFLLLIENAYTNTERGNERINLRDYIDIYLFIKKYQYPLDWEELGRLANHFKIFHQCHRVFENLAKLYPDTEPVARVFDLARLGYQLDLEKGVTLLPWESEFEERLFDESRKRQEIFKLFKKNYFSPANNRFLQPDIPKTKSDFIEVQKFSYFADDRYQNKIGYLPFIDKGRLGFLISIPESLFNSLAKFIIKIQLITDDPAEQLFSRDIVISSNNKRISYLYNDRETEIVLIKQMEQQRIFEVFISLEELEQNPAKRPLYIAYNILLKEYVYQKEVMTVIGATNAIAWREKCWTANILKISG